MNLLVRAVAACWEGLRIQLGNLKFSLINSDDDVLQGFLWLRRMIFL